MHDYGFGDFFVAILSQNNLHMSEGDGMRKSGI
jgi:hypothetical protein